MRKIKSFKLFESNDRLEMRIKEISDVYDDAKSVEYILEEGGYDSLWKIVAGRFTYSIEMILNNDFIRHNSYDDFMKQVRIMINIPGIGKRKPEVAREDIKRFKTLLEEHLDYLPEESIKFIDGGSYYKIEITI